ncbi:3-hydroxybenzoate 6-hydroxylase [Arthrobacter sp. MYb23]|uniref:FAD-dependent oxidoreductase n=1 Tax=unclassified Arthrobacter TaxID=235627 RepID=UPI000CFD7972|nr:MULTISPECIES: FAD-dependent oxidoreductase [unclassified Arthrobacter]PRB43420.1 3-hydroxybenzoate 6-hydroxylase [Arthrobacter sp. MYb51]PRB96922.1 3-hydroxybenzoate 6-hydroxylase [Arthrobacter sp. MYb23]
MPEYTTSTDVLVVGGGMAGLAGALALRENGANVTLVERAPEFGEVGAGLQMAPNASRVLKRWGLLERALEIGVQPKHLVFRDAVTGEELTRQSLRGEFEERYGAPYVVIHRSDLHRVLLEGCEAAGVKLINDVMVDSVETVNGRGVVHTEAGVDYEADVVIGADGLKSTLRPLVASDEPVSSAYVAYRGTVPITSETPATDLEDVVVYLGPDCHLVQYPLRKGELLNTVAVFKSPSFERGEEQYGGVDELQAAYKDCIPAVQAALANLGTGIRWPMYDRDPIENWVAGRMVLMGDAAHPMLQYLAQGACQALEDAAVLQDVTVGTVFSAEGTNPAAWDEAIAAFNSARAARTARVQRSARVWGESWHVSGLARTLRNLLFKSRTDNDFQYNDWLYGQAGEGLPAQEAPRVASQLPA